MAKTLAALAALLCVASAASLDTQHSAQLSSTLSGPLDLPTADSRPWFCHSSECPTYKVVKNASEYEVRQYTSSHWIFTDVEGLLYSTATATGYKRLSNYLSGTNDKSIKIPETTPFTVRIAPINALKRKYTVALWLPKEFQEDPPKPTEDSQVHLLSNPDDKLVYVHSFGGFLVDDITLDTQVAKLKNALLEDRIFFDEDAYGTFTYDKATRLTGRHNEVWYTGNKSSTA